MAGQFTEEVLLVELILSRLPLDAQARCRCLSKGCRSALLHYHRITASVTRNPWVFGVYSVNKQSGQHQVLKAWNRDGRCFTFTLSFLPQFRSSLPPMPCAAAGPWLFFISDRSYERGICQVNPLNSSFKWLPNPPMQNIQSFQPQSLQPWDRRLCCHSKLSYDGMPLCPAYRGSPDNYVLLDCGPSFCQMYHSGERCWKIITFPPPLGTRIPAAALDSHCMTFFRGSFYCLYEDRHRGFLHVVVLTCDMDAPLPSWVEFQKLPPLGRISSLRMISCRPHIYADAITLVCHTEIGITNGFSLFMLPLDKVGPSRWARLDFRLPPIDLRSSQPNAGYADLCCVSQGDFLWFYRKSNSSSRYTKGFQKLHCYCLSSKSWVCSDASPDDSCVLELSGLGTFCPSLVDI